MGRKYEKREKSRGKEKHETSEPRVTRENAPVLCGCPVPEPIECAIGKNAEDSDEGVVMECSNVRCPYVETKIHIQCFRAFEDHLVKLMSNIGSARGWTDAQRRSNLWEKKGQSLVAKVCRCRCGLGTTRRDEFVLYQKKTVAPPANVTPVTNQKKKKTKELPKLNFGVMKTTGNLEEKARTRRTSRRREVSSSTVSSVSHLYNHEYEYTRDSITYHTDSTAISVLSFNPNDIEDNMSDCSRNEVFYDSQESPQKSSSSSKLTKSYASAIKTTPVVSEEHVEAISVDSGVEMKSSATTVSECSDDVPISSSMTVSNCSEDSSKELPLSPDFIPETPKSSKKFNETKKKKSSQELNSFLDFEIGVSTTSTPLFPKQSSKLFSELLVPHMALSEELTHYFTLREELDISEIPEWHLFTGSNFGIGETIIGLTALPGFYNSFQENIQVV